MTPARAPLAGLAPITVSPAPAVPVDRVDLALLRMLATDARMSQRRMAREAGMSASAVGERLARLERHGVIRRYSVEVDWATLGYPVVVYLTVTAVPGQDLAAVARAIRELPEAQDIMIVTGDMDLLVRLRVRDHIHLRELLLHRVWQTVGVQRTQTFFALGEVEPKENFTAQLIAALKDQLEQPAEEEGSAGSGPVA